MNRCIPPTPSSLCAGVSSIFGMKPPTDKPVESVRYLPSTPLLLDSPLGCRGDLELNISRADSPALAASTTALARTVYSRASDVLT